SVPGHWAVVTVPVTHPTVAVGTWTKVPTAPNVIPLVRTIITTSTPTTTVARAVTPAPSCPGPLSVSGPEYAPEPQAPLPPGSVPNRVPPPTDPPTAHVPVKLMLICPAPGPGATAGEYVTGALVKTHPPAQPSVAAAGAMLANCGMSTASETATMDAVRVKKPILTTP